MSEEVFDVCDDLDRVIGQARRSEVHAQGLLHRAVHIWVWNSRSELLIHRRSAQKDEFPGCFTSSASGHLATGEDYEAAAHRELQEELQLAGSLTWITRLSASPATANEHTVLYFLTSDAAPTPDPGEIAEILYLPPAKIAEMVRTSPDQFTPPFRSLFEFWWKTFGNEGNTGSAAS